MGKKPAPTDVAGNEGLHSAARSGDLTAVVAICCSNPLAVNSRDRHSRTPLHLAAWSGHAEIVDYLCKNKADARAAAMDDMGAIHFAAQKGHLQVIKTLMASGVSVKSVNRKGMTALHYAAQGSNIDLVKYLLRKGANKDLRNKAGKTAVDLASSEEMRKFIIEWKPSSGNEVSDRNGCAPLHGEEPAEGQKDETGKRKKPEEEINDEKLGNKKSKVSLNHLLTADDTQENEEDEPQFLG